MNKIKLFIAFVGLFAGIYSCAEHKGPNTYNDNEEGSTTVNSKPGEDNSDNQMLDSTNLNNDSIRNRK